ncbi:MAG TPA: serine hydrolase [Xanthomonadaceae bacterium]|jgi:CubicO group peptidase (beta-lactamase class C family)|nr:serine hydrolase [Xanthomonadaceae bacterium]
MQWIKTTAVLSAILSAAILVMPCWATTNSDSRWIDAQRIRWNVPGVTVVVVEVGKAPRVYASGLCDIARKTPCAADSAFHIGSMTKFFTGLLAATLADDKKLRLDDALIDAWPDFRLSDSRWTQVTLRDLLGGRSGLGSVDWPYFWDQSFTRKDYLERIAFVPMAEPFRAKWAYADANFVAAGGYLERISGKPWEALLHERILDPLEMRDSGFKPPATTTGYGLDASGRDVAMPITTTQAIGPAGSIVSTAGDLSHFLQVVLDDGRWQGRQALPASAIRIATAPVIGLGYDKRFYGPPGAYGFGVFLASYRNNTILHHGGGYPGYSAHFALLPQRKLGVIVLTNRNASEFPEALTLGLLDRALGMSGDDTMARWFKDQDPQATAPASDATAAPTRPLGDYAGRYHHPAWGDFQIIRANDQLRIRFGSYETQLDHYRYDSFGFSSSLGWERMRLSFESDFDGNITSFMLDDATNAQPQRFEKATIAATR